MIQVDRQTEKYIRSQGRQLFFREETFEEVSTCLGEVTSGEVLVTALVCVDDVLPVSMAGSCEAERVGTRLEECVGEEIEDADER